MKSRFGFVFVLLLFGLGIFSTLYVRLHDGRVWWGQQDAGVMILDPHYRCWKIRFCEGVLLHTNGQRIPVRFGRGENASTLEVGRYWIPRFSYVSMARFYASANKVIFVTNSTRSTITIKYTNPP